MLKHLTAHPGVILLNSTETSVLLCTKTHYRNLIIKNIREIIWQDMNLIICSKFWKFTPRISIWPYFTFSQIFWPRATGLTLNWYPKFNLKWPENCMESFDCFKLSLENKSNLLFYIKEAYVSLCINLCYFS